MGAIFQREFVSYFDTPIAYIFGILFLFLTGILTFYPGGFFIRGEADLKPFFGFLPWIFLVLLPAISMRLWSEERRSGAIELLLTLPVTTLSTVLGKFFAAWLFTSVLLGLTFPLWLTVSYLGDPDHGVIFASYIGAALMAGAYLAIGSCVSAATKSQSVAFIISFVINFLFTVSGAPIVLDFFAEWAPTVVLHSIASFSFLSHFKAITQGVIDARDIVYFMSLICFWLFVNLYVIERNKAK